MKLKRKVPLILLTCFSHLCFAKKSTCLFVIERSTNKNYVCYETNLTKTGELNPKNPIQVFWIMAQTDSHKEELTYFENAHAYGFTLKTAPNKTYFLTTRAMRDRSIYISKLKGKIVAEMDIKGRMAFLKKIYVETSEGLFPKVKYVQISGIDIEDHTEVSEQIFPE